MTTPLHALAEIAGPGTAGKEEIVNEGTRNLEQGANWFLFKSRTTTAQPGSPADGDCYIVPASATGTDWAGQDGNVAKRIGTAWVFLAPKEGMAGYVADANEPVAYNGSAWVALVAGGSGGTFVVPVLAAAMKSRTTAGAAAGSSETATNKIMVESKDFDQSTDEFVQFQIPMPESWNEGTITARFVWTAAATGNVVWGIQAVAISDDDAIDATFGAAQTVTDGVTAANDLMISAATSAVTIGGTPAERDFVVFQVYRDADNGSDTLAADAKLLAVRLYFTTNTVGDA